MIQIDGISFGYRRNRLYQDFSLQLAEPGVYGVFGRNGSGKSTLLKMLAGLLFPQRGRIRALGHEPRRRHPDYLAQVYLVPEEFHLPNLSARALARTHAGFYPRFSAAAFADYLRVFELADDHAFGEMSLGQKKKAAMAFALATFTPLLLLDEPTNGLDILGRDQFKDIVARPEQRQRTVLISTHQAHDLERIMSHILFIDTAALALSATMAQLSQALTMGVAPDAAALAAMPEPIYSEPMGDQRAYVAANPGQAAGTVHLELLCKALSRNKDGVLAALRAAQREPGHV
ncbi:ATP-binding cassette domain-containing protein [Arenimonas sp. MALMAid1274]|uniref:ABC transporter ATP-binding protein n=1 Tax=Arenimonas sp. MALMAid1274 TaxID=3411630 RepID=UPI003BA1C637